MDVIGKWRSWPGVARQVSQLGLKVQNFLNRQIIFSAYRFLNPLPWRVCFSQFEPLAIKCECLIHVESLENNKDQREIREHLMTNFGVISFPF